MLYKSCCLEVIDFNGLCSAVSGLLLADGYGSASDSLKTLARNYRHNRRSTRFL